MVRGVASAYVGRPWREKVDVILGGPPGRSSQFAKGGERSINKDVTLIARLLSLHMWGEVNGRGVNRNRDVGLRSRVSGGPHPRGESLSASDELKLQMQLIGRGRSMESPQTGRRPTTTGMNAGCTAQLLGHLDVKRRSSARRKSERFPLIRVQWGSLHETAGT